MFHPLTSLLASGVPFSPWTIHGPKDSQYMKSAITAPADIPGTIASVSTVAQDSPTWQIIDEPITP